MFPESLSTMAFAVICALFPILAFGVGLVAVLIFISHLELNHVALDEEKKRKTNLAPRSNVDEVHMASSQDKEKEIPSLQMDRLQSSNDDLRVSRDALAAYTKTLEQRYAHLDDLNRALLRRNEDLEHENVNWRATWAALQTDKIDLALLRRNEDLEHENVNWRATWTALQTDKTDLAARLSALGDVHAELVAQNAALERNLVYIQGVSARNARQATLCANELRNAESRVADLELQLETNRDVAHMRDELVADTLEELARSRGETATLERGAETLTDMACAQAIELSHADVEIIALREEIGLQEEALASVSRVLAAREETIDTLRGQLDVMETVFRGAGTGGEEDE